jgi:hypothetical protein
MIGKLGGHPLQAKARMKSSNHGTLPNMSRPRSSSNCDYEQRSTFDKGRPPGESVD